MIGPRTRLAVALALLPMAMPALAEPGRVLAIGGSVTEIIYALGAQDRLVARDSTSTFPPEVLALPDVGYMRALSPEGVLSVAPDLILAEAEAGPPEAVSAIGEASVRFVTVPTEASAEGVISKIRTVADALGQSEAGARLAERVAAEIRDAAAPTGATVANRRAIFLLSVEGGRLMAAGEDTAADAMLRLAGASNALSGFRGYKPVSEEAVLAAAPEVVVMMERAGAKPVSRADLFALPGLAATPAAETGALVRMDGLLLLGFGPRTGQAVADLRRALDAAGG